MTLDVGIGEPLSVRQLLTAMREELGKPFPVVDGGRLPGDPSAVWSHALAVRDTFAWQPKHSVRSSIAAHLKSLGRLDTGESRS